VRRSEVLSTLPIVFGLGRFEAAAAIGVSASLFDTLVDTGLMPKPRLARGRRVWDVDELRAAFKALPKADDAPAGEADTWDGV
jgi:hypothetical protein